MVRKLFILTLFLLPFTAFAQFETDTTVTDTSMMRNPEHISIADQLVQDLTTRLTLTTEQAAEIKEILIDYQEEVSGTQSAESADEMFDQQSDVTTDTDVETETETETDVETETETETETDVETETDINTDTSPEIAGSAQEKANSAIEEVLNDTQKTTWAVIKDAWWRDINSRYGLENKLENQE